MFLIHFKEPVHKSHLLMNGITLEVLCVLIVSYSVLHRLYYMFVFFALKVPLHKSNHKSNYTGFTAVCF